MEFKTRLESVIADKCRGVKSEFARQIGIHVTAIDKWNFHRIPSGETLQRIHNTFGVSIDWLLFGRGNPYMDDGEELMGLESVSEAPDNIRSSLSKSVNLLANVLTSGNQMYIQVVLSVLSAFSSAITHTKQQTKRLEQLESDYEELKKRMGALEGGVSTKKKGAAG